MGIEYFAFDAQKLESASEATAQSWPSPQLCRQSDVQYSTFNIRHWELNIWPAIRRTMAAIGFGSNNSKPAKLANVRPTGRPIFNIQYPTFGIEYFAFNAQGLNRLQKQ